MLCSMDVVVREEAALAARSRKLQRHQDDRRYRSESGEHGWSAVAENDVAPSRFV